MLPLQGAFPDHSFLTSRRGRGLEKGCGIVALRGSEEPEATVHFQEEEQKRVTMAHEAEGEF